jgi:hypothetical protein
MGEMAAYIDVNGQRYPLASDADVEQIRSSLSGLIGGNPSTLEVEVDLGSGPTILGIRSAGVATVCVVEVGEGTEITEVEYDRVNISPY